MEVNRKGTVTEYKLGHHYLTVTQWEDGHCEIEIHRCVPELLWHSCDSKQIVEAEEIFKSLEHKCPSEYKNLLSNPTETPIIRELSIEDENDIEK